MPVHNTMDSNMLSYSWGSKDIILSRNLLLVKVIGNLEGKYRPCEGIVPTKVNSFMGA